jgi:hypothetical protein
MIWWVLGIAILSILSYLTDVGVIRLQGMRIPFLNASLLSVLILLAAAGILARMLFLKKKGRREEMQRKIQDLESKLAALGSQK